MTSFNHWCWCFHKLPIIYLFIVLACCKTVGFSKETQPTKTIELQNYLERAKEDSLSMVPLRKGKGVTKENDLYLAFINEAISKLANGNTNFALDVKGKYAKELSASIIYYLNQDNPEVIEEAVKFAFPLATAGADSTPFLDLQFQNRELLKRGYELRLDKLQHAFNKQSLSKENFFYQLTYMNQLRSDELIWFLSIEDLAKLNKALEFQYQDVITSEIESQLSGKSSSKQPGLNNKIDQFKHLLGAYGLALQKNKKIQQIIYRDLANNFPVIANSRMKELVKIVDDTLDIDSKVEVLEWLNFLASKDLTKIDKTSLEKIKTTPIRSSTIFDLLYLNGGLQVLSSYSFNIENIDTDSEEKKSSILAFFQLMQEVEASIMLLNTGDKKISNSLQARYRQILMDSISSVKNDI